jgi:hypothetical protein
MNILQTHTVSNPLKQRILRQKYPRVGEGGTPAFWPLKSKSLNPQTLNPRSSEPA